MNFNLPSPPSSKLSRIILILISIFIILASIALIFLVYYDFTEPYSKPFDLYVSNVSGNSFTISWATAIPTHGGVLVANNYFVDKRLSLTHYVTAKNLKPNTKYSVKVYEGLRVVDQLSLTTGSELSLPLPDPIYGRVVKADQKTGSDNTIVYFRLIDQKNKTRSALLSTLTNDQGRWNLDLANLRSLNLKNYYPLLDNMQEEITLDPGNGQKYKAISQKGQDKPWPNIITHSTKTGK